MNENVKTKKSDVNDDRVDEIEPDELIYVN